MYERIVYIQRIDVTETAVTDRTIQSVERSGSAFSRDAATLLDRYRRLRNQELDTGDAQEILSNTVIAPEETERSSSSTGYSGSSKRTSPSSAESSRSGSTTTTPTQSPSGNRTARDT